MTAIPPELPVWYDSQAPERIRLAPPARGQRRLGQIVTAVGGAFALSGALALAAVAVIVAAAP